MKNIVVIIGIVCTILLNCIYAGAKVEQPKLIATLKIDSINRISVVLENVGLDTILLRSGLYINAAEKNSRLMFYYKTSFNDAWETWERYVSIEPLNVDGGKIELLPNRHKTIFLGKSPFDSCFLKIELATLYRTSKTAGIIKLESNAIYIPRYQSTKYPKVGARSRQKGLRVERVERIGGFDAEKLERSFGLVRFEVSAQTRYAFDLGTESWYQRSVKLDEYYKPFAKGYIAPWKLIPTGGQDVITARYDGKKAIDLSRVRFASAPNSSAIPAEFDESTKTWQLSLPATDAQSSYNVFALYEGQVIGKLRVVSYPKQSYRVRLISVNGQSVGDVSSLSQQLNSIYNQYGVEFKFSETENIQAELSAEHIKQDLKKPRERYEKQHPLAQDEVCVFVLSSELSKSSKLEDVEGLMPRKSRFGYIFAGNSPNTEELARTLAHELGHGLFTLGHTFDSDYNKGKIGATKNLMDYAGEEATELAAYQWNIIANPAPFTGTDRGKDAQLLKKGTIWLTPDRKPFSYDEANTLKRDARVVNGTIGIIIPHNREEYTYDSSRGEYISSNGQKLAIRKNISLADHDSVFLYDAEHSRVYAGVWSYVKEQKTFDFSASNKNLRYVRDVVSISIRTPDRFATSGKLAISFVKKAGRLTPEINLRGAKLLTYIGNKYRLITHNRPQGVEYPETALTDGTLARDLRNTLEEIDGAKADDFKMKNNLQKEEDIKTPRSSGGGGSGAVPAPKPTSVEGILDDILATTDGQILRGSDAQSLKESIAILLPHHKRLAKDPKAIKALVDIRTHRNFKAFDLTDELLGKIASTVNTEGYAQIVTNLRTFIDKFDHNKVKQLKELVKLFGHPEPPFREGAEWTLRYLANHADELNKASSISFEISETLPTGKQRIADMVVEHPLQGTIYYEFKSVKNLPPNDFVEQFSKDLSRPNFNINNLKWVFDGKKIQAKDLQRLRKTLEGITEVKEHASKLKLRESEFVDIILTQVFIVK